MSFFSWKEDTAYGRYVPNYGHPIKAPNWLIKTSSWLWQMTLYIFEFLPGDIKGVEDFLNEMIFKKYGLDVHFCSHSEPMG